MNNREVNFLIEHLAPFVTTHKKEVIEQVLAKRTRYLTVVLEDIYHSHNASAVIRTCDCFGIQDMHVTEKKYVYNINPKVVLGASKWVDVFQYNEPENDNLGRCLTKLKKNGYKIVGTTPSKDAISIDEYKLNEKVALIYGTENSGLSVEATSFCDELLHIPMHGFTESFNISVSVAICLNILTNRLHKMPEEEWQLNEVELQLIRLNWYRKIVPRSEILEKNFLQQIE